MQSVEITGIGHYVPPTTLSNEELEHRLDTTDRWIREHTGIHTRHIATSGATSDLATAAVASCLQTARRSIVDVDCLIVATSTPDYVTPSTAAITLRKLDSSRTWGFDVSAACAGFIYALSVGSAMIRGGPCKRVVVCGAERLSMMTDYANRLTAVLFGDAAAAVLLESSANRDVGVIDVECRLNPVDERLLYIPAGGSARPTTQETLDRREHFISLHGRKVFRHAVDAMYGVSQCVLQRNGLSAADVDWFVPHQANARIIAEVGNRLGIPANKVMVNVDRHGNTSAASIPLCLSQWYANGSLADGARVVLAGFGAGFTMASAYLRWSLVPLLTPQSATGRAIGRIT